MRAWPSLKFDPSPPEAVYERYVKPGEPGQVLKWVWDWRPIESAPTDGTPILIMTNPPGPLLRYPVDGWYLAGNGMSVVEWHKGAEKAINDSEVFTHWMPSPEPPEGSNG